MYFSFKNILTLPFPQSFLAKPLSSLLQPTFFVLCLLKCQLQLQHGLFPSFFFTKIMLMAIPMIGQLCLIVKRNYECLARSVGNFQYWTFPISIWHQYLCYIYSFFIKLFLTVDTVQNKDYRLCKVLAAFIFLYIDQNQDRDIDRHLYLCARK